MFGPISLLLIKVSALLALTLLATRLIRGAAGGRHRLWSGAFVALMLLPALAVMMPPLEIRVPVASSAAPIFTAERTPTSAPVEENIAPRPLNAESLPVAPRLESLNSSSWRLPSLTLTLFTLWIGGVALALGALIVSLLRARRLAEDGVEIVDPEWRDTAQSLADGFGLGRDVSLIISDRVATPMAAGIRQPTIFLPSDAMSWAPDRREVVLAHEIAHLANRDPLRQLLSRVALSIYWFHPLAWIASREATTACEQACDEAVLSLGVRPSTYAQVLLDFATGAPRTAPAAALPIVRRNLLEARLVAILDTTPRKAARKIMLPTAVGAGLTLCIAAVQPTVQVPGVATPSSIAASTPAPVATRQHVAPKAKLGLATLAHQTGSSEPMDCRRSSWTGSGSTENSSRDGSGRIEKMIQKTFSDLRVCAVATDLETRKSRPSEWSSDAALVVLETDERNGDERRMTISRGVAVYTVNGQARPITAEVEEWRRALVTVLDAVSEVSELRGNVSSLRGNISSIYGERSSLQGEISSLRGQVSSMRGEISSLRGEESSMRGEISSIRGHLSSLQGQISSERGAISSLLGSRNDRYSDRASIDAAISRHEDQIRRIQREIDLYDAEGRVREVERRIANFDVEGRVREVERRIRDFDVEAKVRDVERRIARLNVEGQVGSIERDISSMDVENRVAAMEARQDSALRTLRARLGR